MTSVDDTARSLINCATWVGTLAFTNLDSLMISNDVHRDATAGEYCPSGNFRTFHSSLLSAWPSRSCTLVFQALRMYSNFPIQLGLFLLFSIIMQVQGQVTGEGNALFDTSNPTWTTTLMDSVAPTGSKPTNYYPSVYPQVASTSTLLRYFDFWSFNFDVCTHANSDSCVTTAVRQNPLQTPPCLLQPSILFLQLSSLLSSRVFFSL
jgi:hypothetical protein